MGILTIKQCALHDFIPLWHVGAKAFYHGLVGVEPWLSPSGPAVTWPFVCVACGNCAVVATLGDWQRVTSDGSR